MPSFGQFEFPQSLSATIESLLAKLDYPLSRPHRLAEAVLKLSDLYNSRGSRTTPWSEKWAQAGYLAYFFPLNLMRSQAVVAEGRRWRFFEGLSSYLDFGAGPGTVSLALAELSMRGFCHEIFDEPKRLFHQFWNSTQPQPQWLEADAFIPVDLGTFSYALNELEKLPKWAFHCQALMIIEPSTQMHGRGLQQLRDELIQQGFFIWAPCTHQSDCPLLRHSQSDWCHDRIHWRSPEWFHQLEMLLPMKNRTLTYSYLLARRKPPLRSNELARITGDQQIEKGKTKQMLCRGNAREFITWLHRHGEPPVIGRGDLVQIQGPTEIHGAEIRLTPSSQLHILKDDEV